MKKGLNVLSLFDGISCGRIALERAGIPVEKYYSSEVDKYAIQVSEKNYPDIISLGDVRTMEIPRDIDILFAGFPCQSFSIAGKRKGFDDDRGNLFFDLIRIFKEVKPKYFLFENVASMKKSDKKILDEIIGVEGIVVNSALVSAQQRKRIYWTNIPFEQPEDKGIVLKDIIEDDVDLEKYVVGNQFNQSIFKDKIGTLGCTNSRTSKQVISIFKPDRIGELGKGGQGDRVYSTEGKSVSLNALGGGWGAKTGLYLDKENFVRKLTPIECERLQTLPDNYTEGVSNTQRYKQCGNGWTIDIISHILKNINKKFDK